MNNNICSFKTTNVPLLNEAGGKAKALIETTKAGLPVPDGMVLCASFFDPWINSIKNTDEWKNILINFTKVNCDALKAKAGVLRFNEQQHDDFFAALAQISTDFYAVRSSSPEEDLFGTSFAGMYETYLGVLPNGLEAFIAKAFASMLDYRVLSYKKQNNINIDDPKIAIIVQKQIESTVSGIGFSLNPQNNCYDEVLINSSFGLGEAIVSGIVTPDSYIVDMSTEIITEEKISQKKTAVYLSSNGGTYSKDCSNISKPSLTDKQIMEVAKLIKKCETYYGFPIDTEWAFENEKLYLLQCRPITTYFPLYPELLTETGKRKELYFDMIKASQGFEWSMSTLGCDLFGELINVAKQGIMPVGKEGVLYCCHGRIYMLTGNCAKVFGKNRIPKMFSMLDPSSGKLLETLPLAEYIPDRKPSLVKGIIGKSLKVGIKSIFPIIKSTINFEKSLNEYYTFADACIEELEQMRGSQELFINQVNSAYKMYNKFAIKVTPFMMSMLATSSLRKLFKGRDVEADILTLNMDLKGNPTSEMGYHQLKLASSPEFIACQSFEEFKINILNNNFSPEFMISFFDYIRKYGCRGIGEIDIAKPRTHENIPAFFELLKQINTNDNAIINGRKKKQEAYQRLLLVAKSINKEKKFKKIAAKLEWAGIREHPKYMYVYWVDILRENVQKIAAGFVKEGRLAQPEDIFYLTSQQITAAQQNAKIDLKPLVAAEKKACRLTEQVKSWPILFDSRGKFFTLKSEAKEGEFSGNPVAPGIIRGRAKVLHKPFEKKLEIGEILIAPATEPSWTPIFINASGIIMEVGGALQHGAIIAREYGIPCVSGIQDATQIFKDGDLLEVDGTNGIVKIIKEEQLSLK